MSNLDKEIAQQANMLSHLLECAGYLPPDNHGFIVWNHTNIDGSMKMEGWGPEGFVIEWDKKGVKL